MAKAILSSMNAEKAPTATEGIAIIFDFGATPPPLAKEEVEIKNVADALAAIETYKAKVAATGKVAAVSIDMKKGERAPAGFKAKVASFYGVNA